MSLTAASWSMAQVVAGSPECERCLADGWEPFSACQVIVGQNAITRETQMAVLVFLKKLMPNEPTVKLS